MDFALIVGCFVLMEPFFIVSLPGNPDAATTLKDLNNLLRQIEAITPMNIPQLKVGTLDNLLHVGDTSEKTDQFVQQVAYRLEKTMYDLAKNENIPTVNQSLQFVILYYSFFFKKLLWNFLQNLNGISRVLSHRKLPYYRFWNGFHRKSRKLIRR
jgi:hypothetical protein